MKTLICPLNWGLGHATRCVPIIRNLMSQGHEVVIVADGFPLIFLRQEFPTLRYLEFPSYGIRYSKSKSQIGRMILSFPFLIKGIVKEHRWLKNLLQTEQFSQVISDNRFGMWNKSIHSIYITHQLMIKMPLGLKFMEPLAHKTHRYFIDKYDECWIPDLPDDGGLTHDLSHKYPLPPSARFIGTLSRFKLSEDTVPNHKYETVILISGLEPQRSIFERAMIQQFQQSEQQTLLLIGKPSDSSIKMKIGNITMVNHLPDKPLMEALLGCKKIIARSGYSTVMDLYSLDCLSKTQWIPTPGQTEQEYLASVI